MILSEYDRVVCLCVDYRVDREKLRIEKMLMDHGVNIDNYYMFIDGEGTKFRPKEYGQITPSPPFDWIHGKGAYAHFCAMKKVIRQAQEDGVSRLLWVEDDCVFTEEFNTIVESATLQLKQGGNEDWDLLYYGANHSWATTYDVSENVIKCYGSLTTHCLGISSHSFQRILDLPAIHVIDNVISNYLHPSGKCYAIWPNVAQQKPGYSAISNMPCNYSEYFKSKGSNRL